MTIHNIPYIYSQVAKGNIICLTSDIESGMTFHNIPYIYSQVEKGNIIHVTEDIHSGMTFHITLHIQLNSKREYHTFN